MAALPDFDALAGALAEALERDDLDAARALVDAHDRSLRDAAARLSAENPEERQLLIELQRRQLALIESVRGSRDAIGAQLQGLSRGQQAARAYREQDEPR